MAKLWQANSRLNIWTPGMSSNLLTRADAIDGDAIDGDSVARDPSMSIFVSNIYTLYTDA